MDIKKELVTLKTLFGDATQNCDFLLRECAVNSAQLDRILDHAERAVIRLRTLAESIRPRSGEVARKPTAPKVPDFAAKIEVTEFGWLHITLNSLLPSCKYKTPAYLQSTLAGLLTGYQKDGRKLPRDSRWRQKTHTKGYYEEQIQS